MRQSDKAIPLGSPGPLLIADAMLGKLARWLRLLGFDTLYDPDWDDDTIVRTARSGQRIVLTRDRLLYERAGIRSIFIESDNTSQQLRQVIGSLGTASATPGTRCSVCNGLLEEVDKGQVLDRIPPFVCQMHDAFRRCQSCDRIYWQGGHWQRIGLRIDRLLRQADPPASAAEPEASGTETT